MQVTVNALPARALSGESPGEKSAQVAERVARAFAIQQTRQGKANGLLSTREIELHCRPDAQGEALLQQAMARMEWSARAYHRVLKLARTIADLAGCEQVGRGHVGEAVQYRRGMGEG